ncbi:hypothetical protein [Streptomyces sp. NBS 14/10]|uniref:MmyB family transcriptional regulator n=1 Tax=Streptomyces sp. NBS 14/10 TaxID=1945643 RepID=UPI00351D576B
MASVRAALDMMLTSHEPYPAVVVDRVWNVLTGNRAMSVLTDDIPPHLLTPRPNVYRLTLHPDGLAPRLANLGEVRALFLERLRRQADATGEGTAGAGGRWGATREPPPQSGESGALPPRTAIRSTVNHSRWLS